jgi:hypothetical protein
MAALLAALTKACAQLNFRIGDTRSHERCDVSRQKHYGPDFTAFVQGKVVTFNEAKRQQPFAHHNVIISDKIMGTDINSFVRYSFDV